MKEYMNISVQVQFIFLFDLQEALIHSLIIQ